MRIFVLALVACLCASAPARADLDTGLTLFEQGNYSAALSALLPEAEAGNAHAQYVVGIVLAQGYVAAADPPAGADWLRRAAEQGYVQAQVELARMYRTGDGVPEDPAEMVKWYRRAAQQGDVGAQLFIADAYAYGHGVTPDLIEAYAWYEIAMRYWGHLAEHARQAVADRLDAAQIAEAKARAAELVPVVPAQ